MKPTHHFFVDSAGVRIACFDLGGCGQPALLLHGLYGASHEWQETASWLKQTHHVFAIDHRGHGKSSKRLNDASLGALAGDVVSVIESLGSPVFLLGQSIGALIAVMVAGQRPDLVSRLVLIEVHVSSGPPVESWLSKWPKSFADQAEAMSFFESQGLDAETWFDGLVKRHGAYWPKFNRKAMRAIERNLSAYDYRSECSRISAPTLVVAGSRSWLEQRGGQEAASLISGARFSEIQGAGHDVHLDSPSAFREAVRSFIDLTPYE